MVQPPPSGTFAPFEELPAPWTLSLPLPFLGATDPAPSSPVNVSPSPDAMAPPPLPPLAPTAPCRMERTVAVPQFMSLHLTHVAPRFATDAPFASDVVHDACEWNRVVAGAWKDRLRERRYDLHRQGWRGLLYPFEHVAAPSVKGVAAASRASAKPSPPPLLWPSDESIMLQVTVTVTYTAALTNADGCVVELCADVAKSMPSSHLAGRRVAEHVVYELPLSPQGAVDAMLPTLHDGRDSVSIYCPAGSIVGVSITALRRQSVADWVPLTVADHDALRARMSALHLSSFVIAGNVLEQAPLSPWRPLLRRRWFVATRHVETFDRNQRTRRIKSSASQKSQKRRRSVSPTSNQRGRGGSRYSSTPLPNAVRFFGLVSQSDACEAGGVVEAVAYSSTHRGGQLLLRDGRWTSEGVLGRDVFVYHQYWQPAHESREVRIRKFPRRSADVVGVLPMGEKRLAIGEVMDPETGDWYVVWEPANVSPTAAEWAVALPPTGLAAFSGGYSRKTGRLGPFLRRASPWVKFSHWFDDGDNGSGDASPSGGLGVATRGAPGDNNGAASNNLVMGQFYTPCRPDKGVRIRREPTLASAVVGQLECNEVKAACALHVAEDGSEFVEWSDGSGFSKVRGASTEVFLVPVPELKSSVFRRHVVAPAPRAPSPPVTDLDRLRAQQPRRTRPLSHDAATAPAADGESGGDSHPHRPPRGGSPGAGQSMAQTPDDADDAQMRDIHSRLDRSEGVGRRTAAASSHPPSSARSRRTPVESPAAQARRPADGASPGHGPTVRLNDLPTIQLGSDGEDGSTDDDGASDEANV